jgi:hypothetical protein
MKGNGKIFLSARPFRGESVIARSRNPELVERFRDGEAALELLRAASQAGFSGLVTTNDARVLAALKRLGGDDLEVLPVIPNVIGYVRESTHYGMVGAGWRRLRTLNPIDLLRIGMIGAVRAPKVLSRHFPSILEILLEVEMADFRRFRPRVVFLHPVTTDLALAFDNRALFELFYDRMLRHFGCEPGLATNNFGSLITRIRDWQLGFRYFVAPFNDRGYGMLPTKEDCERLFATESDVSLAADRVAVGALPGPEQFEYLRRLGVQSAVVDVTTPEELSQIQTAAERFIH